MKNDNEITKSKEGENSLTLFIQSEQINSLISTIEGIRGIIRQLVIGNLPKNELLLVLQKFNTLFNYNRINILLFIKYLNETEYNIFIVLAKTYLETETGDNDQLLRKTLLTVFDFLFCNSDCNIEVYEYIYQSLTQFFWPKQGQVLTEQKMLDHLTLLSHVYGYPIIPKQRPKNVFYFNGDSKMIYCIGQYKENEIKLMNGFCMSTWFKPYPEGSSLEKEANIIHLTIDNINLSLNITTGNRLSLAIDSELPQVITVLPQNEWICLSISIANPYEKNLDIKVNKMVMVTHKINKIQPSSTIKSVTLYNDFFGESTSTIILNSSLSLQNTDTVFNKFSVGIYKRSLIKTFISLYPIERIMGLFTPIYSFKGNNRINATIGNNEIELINDCGIHRNPSISKKISNSGGINQLLPIIELIHKTKMSSEQVLISYLNVIATILNKCPFNIKEAEESQFFLMLSLFFEKLPNELFNNTLMDKLIEIKDILLKTTLIEHYFQHILLNEIILNKFPIKVQSLLWHELEKMASTDNLFMTYVPMSKMCLLLKCYDSTRYKEYCCQEHADLFNHSNSIEPKIMSPLLKEKITDLMDLIGKILRKTDLMKSNELMSLIEFLSFDLSPCLIKSILTLISELFTMNSNLKYLQTNRKKITTVLINLLITCLPDIKCTIMTLITIVFRKDILSDEIIDVIRNNIYPTAPFYKEKTREYITNDLIEKLAFHCRSCVENKDKFTDQCDEFANDLILNHKQCDLYNKPLYNCLLQLLLNKTIPDLQSDFVFGKGDTIINPQIMEILLDYANKKSYSNELLIDLGKLFEFNGQNCLKFYQNKPLRRWLAEKLSECYIEKEKSGESKGLSYVLLVNDSLLKHSIMNENKEDHQRSPINTIYYVFNHCIKKIRYGGNVFLYNSIARFILDNNFEVLKGLVKEIFTDKYYVSLVYLYEVAIDFMTLLNLKRKRTPSKTLIVHNQQYQSIFPYQFLEGIDTHPNLPNDLIKDIWIDYPIFEKFHNYFSRIWYQTFLKKKNDNILLSNEQALEFLLASNDNKSMFMQNLTMLFSTKTKTTLATNLIIGYVFILTNAQNVSEIEAWVSEFKIFILFNIIAASNLDYKKTDSFFYKHVQNSVKDMILFSIIFLTELSNKRTDKAKEIIIIIIKTIFSYCCMIQSEIFKSQSKKSMLSIFKKDPIKDLYETCVDDMFKNWIQDLMGNPVITSGMISDIQRTQYMYVPTIFNTEPWKSALMNNMRIFQQIEEKFFNVPDFKEKQQARIKEKDNAPVEEKNSNNMSHIYEDIKANIARAQSNWLKWANCSYFNLKEKQLAYKRVKKMMFIWKGMWTNRDIYFDHPEQLKYKVMNHLSRSFSKPLLGTILDINYYVPHFTSFSNDQLFRDYTSDNTMNYITLNVNDILNQSASSLSQVESNGFNCLHQIFTNSNEALWKAYTECNNQIFLCKEGDYIDTFNANREKSAEPKMNSYEKEYPCCRVKLSNHVKGILYLNKSSVEFKVLTKQKTTSDEDKNRIDYDNERKTCFGSYFVYHHKDKDIITYRYPYQQIRYFFRRNYYHRSTGIEIFLINHKSVFLNFSSTKEREEVIDSIINHLPKQTEYFKIDNSTKDEFDNILGYENLFSPNAFQLFRSKIEIKQYISEWKNNKFSNFDMLMFLNIFSNRSYSDLCQYPVFPWLLTNYSTKTYSLDTDLRNLSFPMGMLEINPETKARKQLYNENYRHRETREIDEDPFFFGSHYSNPIYITHYMTRLFPYSHIMVELQGSSFDDPDRLFLSVEKSFKSASTQKSDLRELIPEFFYLPEMFLNINLLNLGKLADKSIADHVECPVWSDNDPYLFIKKHREILEDEKVSASINNWIDLVFGKKQRGKEAYLAENLFFPESYDIDVENAPKEDRMRYSRMCEFGLCPKQIFSDQFPNKIFIKHKEITNSKLGIATVYPFRQVNESNRKDVLIGFKAFSKETIVVINNHNDITTNQLNQIEDNRTENNDNLMGALFPQMVSSIASALTSDNTSSNNASSLTINKFCEDYMTKKTHCIGKINDYYTGEIHNRPVKVMRGFRLLQGGFLDGKILIIMADNNLKETYTSIVSKKDSSPITAIDVDDGDGFIIGGNQSGRINLFHYDTNTKQYELVKQIIGHNKQVNSLHYSTFLNILASSSSDGYVNLYTAPLMKQFRSIYLKGKSCDRVFVSICPLPSLCVISNSDNSIESYSINGKYLNQVKENKTIKSPVLFNDATFSEFIIYIVGDTIKIRALPYLEIVNEIQLKDNKEMEFIDISDNKQYIYATDLEGSKLIVITSQL